MPSIFARSQQMLRQLTKTKRPKAAPRLSRRSTKLRAQDLGALSKRILLPSLPSADEDMTRMAIWEQGRRLARQENWDTFSSKLQVADAARLSTAGGMSEAMLLIMGAHADVVAAASDSLLDGRAPDPMGLQALEGLLTDRPDDYTTALVVAMAHIRIARAWQSAIEGPLPIDTPNGPVHLESARDILSRFDAEALDAPSLAAVDAALIESLDPSPGKIVASYRKLINMDPDCIQYLRAYGPILLSADAKQSTALMREAGMICDQTHDIWGDGAYVWVQIDALAQEPTALAHLDVDLFIQGMRDILKARTNQHIANELAAFCAMCMAPQPGLPRAAEAARARLHACLNWILERHLHELHPRVWAEWGQPLATTDPSTGHRVLLAQGREIALRSIAAFFADQLADGSSIAFSPSGMYRLPAI